MELCIDIAGAVFLLKRSVAYSTYATLLGSDVTLIGHGQLKIKDGSVELTIFVSSNTDGSIDLNITEATVYGMSLFGEVRVQARQKIISLFDKLTPYITAKENARGNISVAITGAYVQSVSIIESKLFISYSI